MGSNRAQYTCIGGGMRSAALHRNDSLLTTDRMRLPRAWKPPARVWVLGKVALLDLVPPGRMLHDRE